MIGIIIIGNEILSAQVEDSNLKHMLRVLNRQGYAISEVRIVPDEAELLIEAIQHMSDRHEFVISTGGIGPTHDDITLRCYAQAFGSELIEHPILMDKIREYFGPDLKASHRSLTLVPKIAQMVPSPKTGWPIIMVKNCFVLPGLPEIFLKKFDGVLAALPAVERRLYAAFYTRSSEVEFSERLTDIQLRYPLVEIGSYPRFDHDEFAAQVTLKSCDPDAIAAVFGELHRMFTEMRSLVRLVHPSAYDPDTL